MTSFENNSQDTKKSGELIHLPEIPRLKADKNKWAEAMQFAEMLNYCRPHLSRTESKFINRYIRPVGISFDKKGNIYKRVGTAPVLWSCHVDTVHRRSGFQKVVYWPAKDSGDVFFGVDAKQKSSCLGADDTCGVWLMLEMIRRQVPGLYIFHRGEECGGLGSKWIASENKGALDGIRFAIAFDRRSTGSIITYQRSTRCCSDEFAESLAEQLGMGHKCDETGAFTDTASYVDLVAECTNISAGYYDAHCSTEHTNVDYLFKLRDAICKVDIAKLVEKRKPGENTRKYSYSGIWDGAYGAYGSSYYDEASRPPNAYKGSELHDLYGHWDWIGTEYHFNNGWWFPKEGVIPPTKKKDLGVTKTWNHENSKVNNRSQYYYGSYRDTVRMIRENPDIIADLLESQGYGPLEIKDYIELAGGKIS